tara:strand:- start:1672 stop:1971 length:300 start_codon:yes stop_codon:yes gene_type:complete
MSWQIEHRVDQKGRIRNQGSLMKIDKVERVSVTSLHEGDWFFQINVNKVTRKLKFEPSKFRDNATYMNQLEKIGVYVLIKGKAKPKLKPVARKGLSLNF